MRRLLLLAAYTGMSLGEIAGLRGEGRGLSLGAFWVLGDFLKTQYTFI
jgi:hypothetical protein